MTDEKEHEYYTEIHINPMANGLIDIYCQSRWHSPRDELYISLIYQWSSWEKITERVMLNSIRQFLENTNEDSFIAISGKDIIIDIDKLRAKCTEAKIPSWLSGKVKPSYRFSIERNDIAGLQYISPKNYESTITLEIRREEYEMSRPKKIFLSHKGVDKPYVREYFKTLKLLGFDPWLDEDAMTAGVPLDRSILSGMEDSIAAVFFITHKYEDENYLADEVNYAIAQIRNRKGFKIIGLNITDSKGRKGMVPKLLTPYVYKTIKKSDQLEGLREIIRALPLEIDIRFNID